MPELGADTGPAGGRPGGIEEPEPVLRQGRRGQDVVAGLLTLGLGLAVLYFFFAFIGTIDMGESLVFTIIAIALILIWLVGAWLRLRAGNVALVTRADRERRGF